MNPRRTAIALGGSVILALGVSCESYYNQKLVRLWNVVSTESDIERINNSWREIISIKKANNIEYIANSLVMTQEVGREGKPIYLDGINWLQELVPLTYEFDGKLFLSDKDYRDRIRGFYLAWLRENRSLGQIEFDATEGVFVGKRTTAREIQVHREWMRGDKHWH